MAFTEIAWWESEQATGSYQFVIEIDEDHLEKLELALANSPEDVIEQGWFKVKLIHGEDR